MDGDGESVFSVNDGLIADLAKWSGTTVTIYTTSGGASGCGFTGVLILCDPCFVRLITCLGPAPCCSLGSTCNTCCCPTFNNCAANGGRTGGGFGGRCSRCGGMTGGANTGICNVGAVVDIPIDRIVAFVHNAV
ncbi:MAG: hypothetical protein WCP73_03655 [Eubacteriales bacterium]